MKHAKTTQPPAERGGIHLGPVTLRVAAALLGAAVVGTIVTQWPHITRYAKIESM